MNKPNPSPGKVLAVSSLTGKTAEKFLLYIRCHSNFKIMDANNIFWWSFAYPALTKKEKHLVAFLR